MGLWEFTKQIAREIHRDNKTWKMAKYFYGKEVAKEIDSIPGIAPTFLMNNLEKAAFQAYISAYRILYPGNNNDIPLTQSGYEKWRKEQEEVRISAEEYKQTLMEGGEDKWKKRLEIYKKYGSIE